MYPSNILICNQKSSLISFKRKTPYL
jgi:hypothetical protein